MDLSTIQCKLEDGVYTSPWDFVNDVWLMFDNAWLYNKKTSKVHKYCTKVGSFLCDDVFYLSVSSSVEAKNWQLEFFNW